MKRLAVAVTALGLALLLVPSAAVAAGHQVNIAGFAFSPHTVTANQGDSVTWTNQQGDADHKVVSDQGFWAGPTLSLNQSYSQTTAFKNAGSYAYHCSIHSSMTGVVQVPLKASGSASTGWQLRWSSLASTPASRNFDVQIKRPGSSTWAAFRSATASRTASFNPARHGSYSFRARTRIVSTGKTSGWSPTRTVPIT